MRKAKRFAAIFALVTTTALAGTALAAGSPVVLKLAPSHFDAMAENFNPYNLQVNASLVQDFAYLPLWIYNVRDPAHDYPAIATSFDVAPDLKSVTYHLRPDMQWSDGKPLTAHDVVFTFDYAAAHPDFTVGFDRHDAAAGTGNIVNAEALDEHTVRFNLKNPDSLAHFGIGIIMPLPEHIWKDVADPARFENKKPVGSGPWTEVTNYARSSFELCRNTHFYGNKDNRIDCLQFPQYATNEQVIAAITSGDLDWAGDGMTDPDQTYTPLSPDNHFWLPPDADVDLMFNTTRKPFDNLAFRQAVSNAIDRETLVTISTFNLTTRTRYPVGTGDAYKPWLNEAALAPYKGLMDYDPDRAREILDKAGFIDKDGDGWRDTPDGKPVEFGISVPADWTDWANAVQSITENLQDVGIHANVKAVNEGAWFDVFPGGDYDAYIMYTTLDPTPLITYKAMFNPATMVPGHIRELSVHQMRMPAVEDELKKAAATLDHAAQQQAVTNIQKLVAENLPVISLFGNPMWYQYSTRHFDGWVTEKNATMRPNLWVGTHERVIHALQLVPKAVTP
nr:ABC transporter substrate-binding protein [uncultured Gellertiella sp.]